MQDETQRGGLEELAADLGEAARWRLVAMRGGRELRPPTPENAASSILVEEIGLDSTLWLSRRFPGERVRVPNMDLTANREARERRAFILAHPQMNAVELARETGFTTRHILQI